MSSPRQSDRTLSTENFTDLARLWVLRILVSLGGMREFIKKRGYCDDLLADAIGLPENIDENFDAKKARSILKNLHAQAEENADKANLNPMLESNSQYLADVLGLNTTERRIFEFAILLHGTSLINTAADTLGNSSTTGVVRLLCCVLGLSEVEVRTALAPKSMLAQSGLLRLQAGSRYRQELRDLLNLLNDNLPVRLLNNMENPVDLLSDMVLVAPQPLLNLSDFSYLGKSLDYLRHYLAEVIKMGKKGVNIYLHGMPGTGKTQLARVLSQEIGCELYAISSENDDGDPISGGNRLRAFRAAQCFFVKRHAMFLFDEVEDVFNDWSGSSVRTFGERGTAQKSKGWMNRMLESNPVPTFWLSNTRKGVDPAFIRRFDMVIELSVPPRQARERLITNNCGDLLPFEVIQRISRADTLAPAVIVRAAEVTRTIKGKLGPEELPLAVEHLVNSTLVAQGHCGLSRGEADLLPDHYNPTFTTSDTNLRELAKGVAITRSARLCFYGPPGTGKTAFGKWLAEELGMPLHVKRASDLLSKWVGDAEKNISYAFHAAENEGAVLLFDEIDSFLQDRRDAQRSWEVTQVNEMLTQMESFSGIFIASTNLMDNIDQAALRRFDLKIQFGYLKREQAWALLRKHCQELGLKMPDSRPRAQLERLALLTPGDFSTVARQHRFRPIKTATDFIEALACECAIKENGHKGHFGFIS